MDVIATPAAMTAWSSEKILAGETIALVPTMGCFHEGHLSLMRVAAQRASQVVVSIFVNPLQFGPREDFSRYPRDLARDLALVAELPVSAVFAPTVEAMYPPDAVTRVTVAGLTTTLCGASRSGHFDGVTTVVAKLFNIVKPRIAVFGRKDLQQLAVIRRMVRDLDWDLEIVGHPIVREPDGLAMSSRNQYLGPEERPVALGLYHALQYARQRVAEGRSEVKALVDEVRKLLGIYGRMRIDYVRVVDQATLEAKDVVDEDAVLALAAFIGTTRLIDNGLLVGRD